MRRTTAQSPSWKLLERAKFAQPSQQFDHQRVAFSHESNQMRIARSRTFADGLNMAYSFGVERGLPFRGTRRAAESVGLARNRCLSPQQTDPRFSPHGVILPPWCGRKPHRRREGDEDAGQENSKEDRKKDDQKAHAGSKAPAHESDLQALAVQDRKSRRMRADCRTEE